MIQGEDKEQDLLQQILRGDIIAMKELYNNYSGYLTAVCSRYITNRDDVRDVSGTDSRKRCFTGKFY